jgi:hypothetical protein
MPHANALPVISTSKFALKMDIYIMMKYHASKITQCLPSFEISDGNSLIGMEQGFTTIYST